MPKKICNTVFKERIGADGQCWTLRQQPWSHRWKLTLYLQTFACILAPNFVRNIKISRVIFFTENVFEFWSNSFDIKMNIVENAFSDAWPQRIFWNQQTSWRSWNKNFDCDSFCEFNGRLEKSADAHALSANFLTLTMAHGERPKKDSFTWTWGFPIHQANAMRSLFKMGSVELAILFESLIGTPPKMDWINLSAWTFDEKNLGPGLCVAVAKTTLIDLWSENPRARNWNFHRSFGTADNRFKNPWGF